MVSIKDIDKAFAPTEVRVRVPMAADVVAEIVALEARLREEQRHEQGSVADGADAVSLAERIVALREQAAASEVEFRFVALGRKAYTDLLAAHPAPDGSDDPWDAETFPPALCQASCVDPDDSTVDWWTRVYLEWPAPVFARVWQAVLAAHVGVSDVPPALTAFDVLRRSAQS